jgi:3-oxoacyl-(acyl-carrier-protein) synthase
MNAYITSYGVISPQQTHDAKGFPHNISGTVSNRLICQEPDYRQHINPIQLRRMPRILKMGLASASICLNNTGVVPDGIVVGTGLGCLESLEKFLMEVLKENEQVTSVLPFINSTHNAVASQIAMMLKNNGYNFTYCHRALSFESALQDALLLIEEGQARHVLAGGIDECTDHFMHLQNYLGQWKAPVNNLDLFSEETPGTIAGEGSAFFLLSNTPHAHLHVQLRSVRTLFSAGTFSIDKDIDTFLSSNGMGKDEIDVVLLGLSGDRHSDSVYRDLMRSYFSETTCFAAYKHLCGTYYSSSAFALWLAAVMLHENLVPSVVRIGGRHRKKINNILVYNHFRNTEHAFMLLSHAS